MAREVDCLVIGAGPAGCTAGALVAEQGFSTMLLERDTFPRFHVGESLMPETYWTFRRLGVLDRMKSSPFVRKVGVQFAGASGRESQPFYFVEHDPRECSQTWHVERARFDEMLFRNATEKGAECRDETRVLAVNFRDGGPHEARLRGVDGKEESIDAKVIVDATGQQAFLANRLGLRRPNPQLRKAAIWGHFRNAKRAPEGEPEVTMIIHGRSRRVWFWYIPLADNKVSVGLVGDNDELLKRPEAPEDVFHGEVSQAPAVASRLADAQLVDRLYVDREFSYTTDRHAGDGWVLVGDAFGFIDPVYSTGVMLALRSGELAADAIVEGLRRGDVSATQLGKWCEPFKVAVERFRALVTAFYSRDFSFASFIMRHPDHRARLTDLLIGRGFTEDVDGMLADLERMLREAS